MRMKNVISGVVLLLFCLTAATAAHGQANANKAVFHFGAGYYQAQVDNAETGFFGADLYAGKMITNSLCLGLACGYNIVHYYSYDVINSRTGETQSFSEKLSIIPILAKAKYYFTISPMVQMYGGLGAGYYRSIPALGDHPVGGIKESLTHAGGSVSIGLDYWFLLTTGVGFEFEYHIFGKEDHFKYWALRVDYCLIKF
ncbi:MAG: outer membrane beta-barrel protein [Candidatus Krumholzibacteriota bacterium]|nr:outer membrane beta-barrel protein [Candidatus Krumholzibacteriota bacterium]